MKTRTSRRRLAGGVIALAVSLIASGCAFSREKSPDATTVVLITHDSWAMDPKVIAAFEKQSGYTLKVRPQGDAGSLTNKLVLTKSDPLADAVFGIDNTFASRAYDAGVLSAYVPKDPAPGAERFALDEKSGAAALTPVDYGDVCINVDDAWFARHGQRPPRTLVDLTRPEYRDQLVVPSALTSSPGFAFLLATVGAADGGGIGDWQGYWRKLVANGVKVDSGWTEAYENDFTASGKGTRPIVVSYASSIPFTIPKKGGKPTTSALLDTCFRQVEYAGVLAGAKNPAGAKALIDFMQTRAFQQALPDQMYVFPVDRDATLPDSWKAWARVAPKPFSVRPSEIAEHRTAWLREWQDITSR